MATTTRSRSSNRASSAGRSSNESIFRFGSGEGGRQAGVLAAAAVAGAAVGFAANYGRKLFVQGMEGTDWSEMLKAEHDAALALFEKIEATSDDQTSARTHLLTKLKHALGKHAFQEENVIYPALREANSTHDADALNSEHGYIKTYLYELETMPKDSAEWLARLRDFHSMIREHMRMEEDEVFPKFHDQLSDEQNSRLSAMMSREGMMLA